MIADETPIPADQVSRVVRQRDAVSSVDGNSRASIGGDRRFIGGHRRFPL
jgi:hypothetical protein